MLTPKVKNDRATINKALLTRYNADIELFHSRMVIGDEAWVHYHNTASKFESTEGKHASSSRRKMLKITNSTTKTSAWSSYICNKITLPYTSTKLPNTLCAIVGVNCYHTQCIFRTWLPAIISFFFKSERGVAVAKIRLWKRANIGCEGVLQRVWFSLLLLRYKCTAKAVYQAYRVTRRLCWIKYNSHLWVNFHINAIYILKAPRYIYWITWRSSK